MEVVRQRAISASRLQSRPVFAFQVGEGGKSAFTKMRCSKSQKAHHCFCCQSWEVFLARDPQLDERSCLMFLYVLSVDSLMSLSSSGKLAPSGALSTNGNCIHVSSLHRGQSQESISQIGPQLPPCLQQLSITWSESTAESPNSSTNGNMEKLPDSLPPS